ncbi:major facilitator superfamily domain-containing 8-like [Micractinium conductrix]|uniref:Major facilitator superfamily domain-containing 8-like n=1 Tax=Micractinium conductrix TaxID=554055 RepID=A0A2P6VS19_9CHLO|nr:major facilitator superfamily domain-containing 8-like [Micractinium conductrix]|eukprot:PSC76881.1 major facilitator superfamily domain-containing 8-like [Micractinium conductrix]
MARGPIGYTVHFIRGQLAKRRGETQPEGGQESKAAEPGADAAAAPQDEEGFGKGAAPKALGEPFDPAHALTKRRSLLALVVMGFGLALDFTLSLMSIQPLFYVVGGPQSLYGFVFGCYDLSAMLFAPLFGVWTDRSGRYKAAIQVGAAVNAAGNLVYAFTVLADQWWIMAVARLVAGVGAATLGIGSSYITRTTTHARRQVVLGRYRITQTVARMAGPMLGFLFLGLPEVHAGSSTALKIFNWYTIPGWAAFLVVMLLMTFFAWAFEDPTEENEHLVKADAEVAASGPPSPQRVRRFRSFALPWIALSFFAIFAFNGFTANLFALFAGQYHEVTSQMDNWKTYVGMGAGSFVCGMVVRRCIKWFPWFEERKLVMLSNWLVLLTWVLVIPYGGETWVPPVALFYAATGLAGFAVVINQASLETIFSKKVTQYGDVAGGSVGRWMGAYFCAASAGRFAGPLVVAAVTRIATPSGVTGYCSEPVTAADGSLMCATPQNACLITGNNYYVEGCVLYNAIPMYAAMAGLQLCVNLGLWWVLAAHWSYDNEDLPAPLPAGASHDVDKSPTGIDDAAAADEARKWPAGSEDEPDVNTAGAVA